MKQITISFVLLLTFLSLFSCTDEAAKQEQDADSTETTPATDTGKEKNSGVFVDSILQTKSIQHAFSDPAKQDSFILVVKGISLLDAQVTFSIRSSEGTVLHAETFPSNYLVGYGFIDTPNPTIEQQEEYIKKRMNEFFDEKNFSLNPLKNQSFDKNYSKKEIWEDIKSDSTAIGFSYLLGKEDGRKIAFSKKKKAVVLYFNCC